MKNFLNFNIHASLNFILKFKFPYFVYIFIE